MKCIIFTNNQKKCDELQEILASDTLDVVRYRDIVGDAIEVIEDGKTFEENALKKVNAIAHLNDAVLVADDSGLEIDCLDGQPGIYSARYGGEALSDSERCEYVLEQIKDQTQRHAKFRCVIALIFPTGEQYCVEGVVEGTLTYEQKGSQGFGYDPLFIPDGYQETFAELGANIKHKISHRGQALEKASALIRKYVDKVE